MPLSPWHSNFEKKLRVAPNYELQSLEQRTHICYANSKPSTRYCIANAPSTQDGSPVTLLITSPMNMYYKDKIDAIHKVMKARNIRAIERPKRDMVSNLENGEEDPLSHGTTSSFHQCDNCQNTIKERRYQCGDCSSEAGRSWDLCHDCISNSECKSHGIGIWLPIPGGPLQRPRHAICNGCRKLLGGTIAFHHCLECSTSNPSFDLCENCYSTGFSEGSHKTTHLAALAFLPPLTGFTACDSCRSPRGDGAMFHCRICSGYSGVSYDLCERCVDNHTLPMHDDFAIRISGDSPKCEQCHELMSPGKSWIHCLTCPSFDLCSQCENHAQKLGHMEHPFVRCKASVG